MASVGVSHLASTVSEAGSAESAFQPDRDVTVCLCDFGAEKAESPDPFFDVLRFDWPKTQRHVGLIHSLDILFSG